MWSYLVCAVLLASPAWASSGRAFPVASENFAIELFETINPNIEWDPTNFLVDLSGRYANCKQVGKRGVQDVDRNTPEGDSIAAVVDDTKGSGGDVVSVNSYIEKVLTEWARTGEFNAQIQRADRFGCSVRPACRGSASIACLFSPGSSGGMGEIENPTEPPQQYALAFTGDQYQLAESITGNKWDRSHLLENLSGYETQCAMIDTQQGDWSFHKAYNFAKARGMRVTGLFGSAPNTGSTEEAMVRILNDFKKIRTNRVGCSVIPDCMYHREDIAQLYVVVSCVYEE